MINFITIINIDTPTWPLPANTSVPKHTQNSYGGTLFQQVVGIPMGTNCVPLLADLFFILI